MQHVHSSEWPTFILVMQVMYRVAQKSKPLPNYQKIILKPANEIIFLRQIKVSIKYCKVIRWY